MAKMEQEEFEKWLLDHTVKIIQGVKPNTEDCQDQLNDLSSSQLDLTHLTEFMYEEFPEIVKHEDKKLFNKFAKMWLYRSKCERFKIIKIFEKMPDVFSIFASTFKIIDAKTELSDKEKVEATIEYALRKVGIRY